MNRRAKITAIAGYAPQQVVCNGCIESWVNEKQAFLPEGAIERMFGVKQRRFAASDEQVSDLAVAAANNILLQTDKSTIDFMIFAAASSDLIEPATANIIQSKLQIQCPVLDVKNACNSFVSAIHIANSFIASGIYKKILVVNGEKLSQAIKFDLETKEELMTRIAAYSLGDAGAAVLIEPSEDESGIYKERFESYGAHWNLCTIPGGGSMHPHDASKNYFEGKTTELRNVFLQNKGRIAEECLKEIGWQMQDIDHFFMHHVSRNTFEVVAASLGLTTERFFHVIENYGNIAAASIPFAMSKAAEMGKLKKGDKIMVIGLASGISMSIQLMIW
jgi:3-oxoacyl-[acyl-carrier-protein] synthase-3